MSENEDVKLLDHEYDGIQELDNNLPMWWLWTFLGAIIFSFIYWLHYSFTKDGPNLDQELSQQMAWVEKQRSAPENGQAGNEMSVEEKLMQGKKLFVANCASCHKENGAGNIGPNLTDAYWIHGSKDEQIEEVIEKGVLDKGMPPWSNLLKPAEVHSLVIFIGSLRNTNVSDGKEPQGEKVN